MLYSRFVFLIIISAICHIWAIKTDLEENEEAKLHKDLLKFYGNTDTRPVKDHKASVNVKVRLALKYLSFDSLEETITIHSWLVLSWKDEYLTWTPSDYGDIQELQVRSHKIWTPDIALLNKDPTVYQFDSLYTTCLVSNYGKVTCVPNLSHTAICRTQLRNWPYDTQNCSFYFGSSISTDEKINFTFFKTKPILLDEFKNGPGWKLLNATYERIPGNKYSIKRSFPRLKYIFKLEREAAGPAAIVVVPTIVIVLLTLTSLLMDIKDNTRLVLAFFSLFSHFIFLTEIGYDIPKHSADTPLILLFIRDSMIITLTAILVTLFLMYLRRKTVTTPAWIITFNRLVSSGPGRYVVFTEFHPCEVTEAKTLTESISGSIEERTRVFADWMQFANVLNSCIFIVSFVVYLVLICVYIPRDN